MALAIRISPMRTAGTQHFIERTYRESGVFQWAREAYINAIEAGATRVLFGVEWQGVENQGIYRRLIADNGKGMTAEELVEFFNTFGGGGKPIGGAHENFGVGAKTSLLPWNRYGLVVVSWVDREPSMIWVQRDPVTGEYGLRLEDAVDEETGDVSIEEVYAPYYDDLHGLDWAAIRPDWIGDSGTVVVLMGDGPGQHTVLGDPTKTESDIKGLSTYLNRRVWEIPEDTKLHVDEFRTQERGDWPRNEAEAHGPQLKDGPDRRTNHREIMGARFFVEYPVDRFTGGGLAHFGTVTLSDETEVDWYLWEGERPAVQSYASIGGYIGALYRNELYDVTSHNSTYRSFGVGESKVRSRLWLIIRPPLLADGRHGVYPRQDRNSLLLQGGPYAGHPLPLSDWAGEFADRMSEEAPAIVEAIKAARAGDSGSIEDETWRARLAERFGSRWRIPKLRVRKTGNLTVDPTQAGGRTQKRKSKKVSRGGGGLGAGGLTGGALVVGSRSGEVRAVKSQTGGGLPHYRAVNESEFEQKGILAAWQPKDPVYPEGAVLINSDHPVLRGEIEYWQSQYADHHAEEIEDEVVAVYGQMAVAKIAHSEYLKGIVPTHVVESEMRSPMALTMSLLGLIGEEAVIAPRIGGKFKKRRSA
jgi:hypothetical protein